MQGKYIFRLTDPDLPNSIGNKASNMLTLSDLGLNIPDTYVCTWDAYLDQDGMVQESIKAEIENILDPNITYAVRSSVNVEDTLEHSYAGQFSTILEVSGVDELITAIQQVWDSAAKDEVRSYQQKTTSVDQDVKIAVIIQAMIAPRFSGVVFSKNPITGLDEIVIEAVEGVGTALVQDGATPLRWIHKWGDWLEKPPGDQKLEDLALKVVQQTEWIVKKTGKDVDLEWVYDGKELYWVQLREITALKDLRIYSNKISKEFLPGLIKPLVWSINVPLVNSAWVDLLSEVIGENDIDPSSMARSFYYRAYFDMTTFGEIFDRLGMPRQSLEINMGIVEPPENRPPFRPSPQMMALLPRILGFLINKWRFSRQVEAHFPEIETKLKAFDLENVDEYCLTELFAIIDQLYRTVGEAAYYNIIVPVLMFVYNGALRRQLGKIDIEFEKINLTHDMDELQDYDPNVHLARLNQEYRQLDSGLQDSIREVDYQAFTSLPGSDVFQELLQQFIERFGHFSDSGNDFSVPPWREDKDLILKLIINYQPAYGSAGSGIGFGAPACRSAATLGYKPSLPSGAPVPLLPGTCELGVYIRIRLVS